MSIFKETAPKELTENPFSMIGDKWMLVTGTKDDGSYNTMTASWGGVGVLWNKAVAFLFIRPQRYTFEFTESSDKITLSFFDEKYRDALKICGSKSGRNCDKAKEAGLTPVKAENGSVYFEEAETVMICRKVYSDELRESSFVDKSLLLNYSGNDYHHVYAVSIEKVLKKS